MNKQSNRILAIDLARGISVLLVVFVHVLWIYASVETQENTPLGMIIQLMGKGTPMFLIAMGISFTLSSKQSLKLSLKRGVSLLALAYGMNFLKFILPAFLNLIPEKVIHAYGWTGPLTFDHYLYLFQTGDILQLAGIALLLLGIMNYFSQNKYVPLTIALLTTLSCNYLRGIHTGIFGIDYLLDLLWGGDWNVYFAVFPWISFILIGVFFGRWYQDASLPIHDLFKKMAIIGGLLTLIGGGLYLSDPAYHFGDYFHLGSGGTIYLTGFNLLLFGVAYLMVTKIKQNRFFEFLFYCSKRVTTLYIIQWVIIFWGMAVFGFQEMNQWQTATLIPLFLTITLSGQKILDIIFSKKNSVENRKAKPKKVKEDQPLSMTLEKQHDISF